MVVVDSTTPASPALSGLRFFRFRPSSSADPPLLKYRQRSAGTLGPLVAPLIRSRSPRASFPAYCQRVHGLRCRFPPPVSLSRATPDRRTSEWPVSSLLATERRKFSHAC